MVSLQMIIPPLITNVTTQLGIKGKQVENGAERSFRQRYALIV